MNLRIFTGLAAAACILSASCTPWPERPAQTAQKKAEEQKKSITSKEQQKIQEQRDSMKKKAETEKTKVEDRVKEKTDTVKTETTAPKQETKPSTYPYANKVPGKDGFVFSPYNNKVIDVRDIPTGQLVQDPTYPAAEKKYFRVP
ncbi:MAG: hypothetical protein Q7R22_010320 [Verrucomicrobiota bacterium JB025]|nr:hypothetical protein [Verrucomicrobiota bacterium JB025]